MPSCAYPGVGTLDPPRTPDKLSPSKLVTRDCRSCSSRAVYTALRGRTGSRAAQSRSEIRASYTCVWALDLPQGRIQALAMARETNTLGLDPHGKRKNSAYNEARKMTFVHAETNTS